MGQTVYMPWESWKVEVFAKQEDKQKKVQKNGLLKYHDHKYSSKVMYIQLNMTVYPIFRWSSRIASNVTQPIKTLSQPKQNKSLHQQKCKTKSP